MTVVGDDIVLNCRNCFSTNGFGMRLEKSGEHYTCSYCKSRYVLEAGLMRRV